MFVVSTLYKHSLFYAGDKKRRDVVQCIVHVPKYDFYIIASQKGIICQWSSKVHVQPSSNYFNYKLYICPILREHTYKV